MAGSLGCDFPSASIGILTGPTNNSSGAQLLLQIEGRLGSISSFNSKVITGQALVANLALDGSEPTFLRYEASGANRDVNLVLGAAAYNGQIRRIVNAGAANNIVVKDSTGATTFATLTPGQSTTVICLNNTGSTFSWMLV